MGFYWLIVTGSMRRKKRRFKAIQKHTYILKLELDQIMEQPKRLIQVANLVFLMKLNNFLEDYSQMNIQLRFQKQTMKLYLTTISALLLSLLCSNKLFCYERLYIDHMSTLELRYNKNKTNHQIRILDKRKELYRWAFSCDCSDPKIDFIDLNGDAFTDIYLRLMYEGEYELILLINKNNNRFIDALPNRKKDIYLFNYDVFNTELYETGGSNLKEYELIKNKENGKNSIRFHHLIHKKKLNKHVEYSISDFKLIKTKVGSVENWVIFGRN